MMMNGGWAIPQTYSIGNYLPMLISLIAITVAIEFLVLSKVFKTVSKHKMFSVVLAANLASYLSGIVLWGLV